MRRTRTDAVPTRASTVELHARGRADAVSDTVTTLIAHTSRRALHGMPWGARASDSKGCEDAIRGGEAVGRPFGKDFRRASPEPPRAASPGLRHTDPPEHRGAA
ncbi:hypothetical protein GCM10010264_09990 [Streptomyces globisporus]|nr:hypothetical protein GCM10010264_09990 [Streptomyces globisporus]